MPQLMAFTAYSPTTATTLNIIIISQLLFLSNNLTSTRRVFGYVIRPPVPHEEPWFLSHCHPPYSLSQHGGFHSHDSSTQHPINDTFHSFHCASTSPKPYLRPLCELAHVSHALNDKLIIHWNRYKNKDVDKTPALNQTIHRVDAGSDSASHAHEQNYAHTNKEYMLKPKEGYQRSQTDGLETNYGTSGQRDGSTTSSKQDGPQGSSKHGVWSVWW